MASAEKACLATEKEPRPLEGGGVHSSAPVPRVRAGKRTFLEAVCSYRLFSTNSLPLPPHGSLGFEIPDFMMSKLCFNVY